MSGKRLVHPCRRAYTPVVANEYSRVSHADARLFPIVARTLAEKVPETVQICRSLHRLVLEPLMLDSPPHEELVRFVASDDSDDPKLLSFILSLT